MPETPEAASIPVVNTTFKFGDDFAEAPQPTAEVVADLANDASAVNKVSREVDFGNGPVTLEADTAEALLDLMTAEAAKSKPAEPKVKRQPSKEGAVAAPKELTADELFTLSQELSSNPATALDKILQAQTGLTAAQLRQIGVDHASQAAERAFLAAHPTDFKPSPANAEAITSFLATQELPYTAANLEYAFQELSEAGKLEVIKPPSSEEVVVPAHTRRKPLSTGLSNKQGAPAPNGVAESPGQVTEAEVAAIYAEPDIEKARRQVLSLMRRQSAAKSTN